MKKWLLPAKKISVEFFIVLLFALLVQDMVRETITGDGQGYYDYLPSIFIYSDINRKDFNEKEKAEFEKRIQNFGFYLEYDGHFVNRYPCGTAVLESPFFLLTWLFNDQENNYNDGYQLPFHNAVFISALFYLFLALLLLKNLLRLYDLKNNVIYFSQLLMVFATSVTQYASLNSAFSHVYSLFAVTAFLYFSRKFFIQKNSRAFLWASLFFGLVVILRNINLVILFFLPFLAGSWENLKTGFRFLFHKPLALISGTVIVAAICFIQSLLWYLQTGHFLLYSYQGDGFNFLDPQFMNILISYRKGLFVYTPILFLGMLGIGKMLWQKRYFEGVSWLAFFVLLTYLLSSWEWWYYGRSYGLRAYIDFYAIFFIPFAILLTEVRTIARIVIISLAVLTIPLNLIQNYQYTRYILHGTEMTKKRYWNVFLKTHDSYKGIYYKRNIDIDKFDSVFQDSIKTVIVAPGMQKEIWTMRSSKLPDFSEVSVIQVTFDNEFIEKDHSRLLLTIKDEKKVSVFHRPYFIQFTNGDFNRYQKGVYNFELPKLSLPEEQIVTLTVSADRGGVRIENFTLNFLKKINRN